MNSFTNSIEDILEKNSLIDSLLPELQDYDILRIIKNVLNYNINPKENS